MVQVKDARKLLDEPVGGLWLAHDDGIVDVAQYCELMAHPEATIRFQVVKMQLEQGCAQMLCPEYGHHVEAIKCLVETPDDVVVLDELLRWYHQDLCCDGRVQEGQ